MSTPRANRNYLELADYRARACTAAGQAWLVPEQWQNAPLRCRGRATPSVVDGAPSAPRRIDLPRRWTVKRCETCGNDYDRAFQVVIDGVSHVFDSFECAIEKLAPRCAHCGLRIIGHGTQKAGRVFCCAHCAAEEGVTELRDRA
jgi:hypothetical protein